MTSRAPGNTRHAPRTTRHVSRATRHRSGLWALLAPYLIGTIVLALAPAVLSLALAFTEYDALSPPVWRGLDNFHEIFSDELFLTSLRNSAFFVLLAAPLRLGGALALALLLSRRRRGLGAYRVAVYLPTVIPDVAYALIWLWIFNPIYGPLNQALSALGLPAPVWLLEPDTARLAIVIMSLFQIGEGFVVLLAGREEIPPDYYHAAAVDGAGPWQMFRLITLPLLAPWLLVLTIRDALLSAQSTFTPALLMTGGGPYYATLFTPLLVYQEAFDRFRFGRAAAMMLVLLLGLGLLLWLVTLVARGWGEGEQVSG